MISDVKSTHVFVIRKKFFGFIILGKDISVQME